MITKQELQEYARLKGLTLGNAEKDYLIDIALLSISKNTKNELVFKGGTCLYKFHKLNRFSQDLDFSAVFDIDTDKIMAHLILDFERFRIKAKEHRKREPYNSILITLRIEGPLFSGKPISYANLGVDINMKSKVFLEPETITYNSIYPDMPLFNAYCMKKEEIFAEKIRAIMTRKRARDLFDLNFLIENNIFADRALVEKKMQYYNKRFDIGNLLSRIRAFKGNWKRELTGFTEALPDFNIVYKNVIKNLSKIYKNMD